MTAAPPDGLALRESGQDDGPALAEIYGHHVLTGLASFEEMAPDAAEMARRRAALVDAGWPHLVAERGGRVVGFAYGSPWRPRPAYRWTIEDSVYVAPDALGGGIGRALLSALIDRATAGGWRQMMAVIGDSGNAASIALHARLGFRPVGTLEAVGFKHGRWVDVVLMQRALGPGSAALPESG